MNITLHKWQRRPKDVTVKILIFASDNLMPMMFSMKAMLFQVKRISTIQKQNSKIIHIFAISVIFLCQILQFY